VLVFKGGTQPKERLVGLQTEANYTKILNKLLEQA
jgi:hypothetical protein